eukprot:15462166-Alexandrium_andersonii.AAC.1
MSTGEFTAKQDTRTGQQKKPPRPTRTTPKAVLKRPASGARRRTAAAGSSSGSASKWSSNDGSVIVSFKSDRNVGGLWIIQKKLDSGKLQQVLQIVVRDTSKSD